MRNARGFLVAFLLLCVVNFVDAGQEEFYEEVSVTDTNTVVEIVLVQSNNLAQSVTIVNDSASPNDIFYDTSDGVATTSNAKLKPGESRTINSGNGKFPITSIGIICDTGESATARVFALPSP